jgi:hypothetical protein
MICSQCGALVIEDRFMEWTARWRCLKCGHVQDSVNVENHLARQRADILLSDYVDEETYFGSESYVRRDVTAQCRDQRDPYSTKRHLKRLIILMLLAFSAAPAYAERVQVNTDVAVEWSVSRSSS